MATLDVSVDRYTTRVLYHSIHCLDPIRFWMGKSLDFYAKTVRNAQTHSLAATKSSIILDYGDKALMFIVTTGLNLEHRVGKPDTLSYIERTGSASDQASRKWTHLSVEGRWVPDAFIGGKGALQPYVEGWAPGLPNSYGDAFATTALVEVVYKASAKLSEPVMLH